jgi:hypothetical protein
MKSNMKSIEKFGKRVSYNVNGNYGSWMLIEEAGDKWLYLSDKQMDVPAYGVRPIVVGRKGMLDLLVHFGCGKSATTEVFNRTNND